MVQAIDFITWLFYCLWLGLDGVWQIVYSLPWPDAHQWFGSLCLFVGLYPLRLVMAILVPEHKVANRIYKRRKSVPSTTEHQIASAASTSFLHF